MVKMVNLREKTKEEIIYLIVGNKKQVLNIRKAGDLKVKCTGSKCSSSTDLSPPANRNTIEHIQVVQKKQTENS